MEPVSIIFYAVICGLLSVFAPNLGGALPRMTIGAVVGIAAALALPYVRGAIGY